MSHRPQASFQLTMVGFDAVVAVLLAVVPRPLGGGVAEGVTPCDVARAVRVGEAGLVDRPPSAGDVAAVEGELDQAVGGIADSRCDVVRVDVGRGQPDVWVAGSRRLRKVGAGQRRATDEAEGETQTGMPERPAFAAGAQAPE
jgi:hypothetical protein